MNRELISKGSRNAFREVLVGYVLREIHLFFEAADLTPDLDHNPMVDGMRRGLVEQYYARIDFSSTADIERLLFMYEGILLRLYRDDRDEETEEPLRLMEADGYHFDGERFVPLTGSPHPSLDRMHILASSLNLNVLKDEIERLADSVDADPPLVVGTSKELVETICKTVLEDRGVPLQNEDITGLVRATAKELSLLPSDIPDRAKGAKAIRRILSNLTQITQGVAELRNLYGTGHGPSGRFVGLQPRHARLVMGAAATLGMFLLETHLDRSSHKPVE